MRFESLLWLVLAMLLSGGVGWDGGSAQPPQDAEQFEAADGGTEIPPPRP
jgi:hypothetical protein